MKPKKKMFARLEGNDDVVGELEVMGLQHFILPFSFLGIGLVLSTVVWTIELIFKHMIKSCKVAVDVADVDMVATDVDVAADIDVDIDNVDVDVDDVQC